MCRVITWRSTLGPCVVREETELDVTDCAEFTLNKGVCNTTKFVIYEFGDCVGEAAAGLYPDKSKSKEWQAAAVEAKRQAKKQLDLVGAWDEKPEKPKKLVVRNP